MSPRSIRGLFPCVQNLRFRPSSTDFTALHGMPLAQTCLTRVSTAHVILCGQPSKPTQDFGVNFGFRTDLTLKPVYADTSCSSQRAAQRLALPVGVVDTLLEHLYPEHFIENSETVAPFRNAGMQCSKSLHDHGQ